MTYFVYIFPRGGGRTPSKAVDVDDEDPAPLLSLLLSPDSGKKHQSVNKDRLKLRRGWCVAGSANSINAKYDVSYSNSENENRLLGQLLTRGQACGIVSLCLYGADIPMGQSGMVMYIYHILHIYHI